MLQTGSGQAGHLHPTSLVTAVVPVYNEEGTIRDLLSQLIAIADTRMEVVVVDDGSTDGTSVVLDEFRAVQNVTILRHDRNRGKGAALRTGFNHSKGDVIVIQDADLEYDPRNIRVLADPILSGEEDIVFGSRFLGSCEGMSFSHRMANWGFSAVTTLLFMRRVTDVMTGHKAFSRNTLREIVWTGEGFEGEIGITVAPLRRRQLRFAEVPISYKYRLKGSSKIRPRDGLICLLMLLRIRIRA